MTARTAKTDPYVDSRVLSDYAWEGSRPLEPSMRVADLRRVASGGRLEGPGLAERLRRRADRIWPVFPPGRLALQAQAWPGNGFRFDGTGYGWPRPWFGQQVYGYYDDALTGKSPQAPVSAPGQPRPWTMIDGTLYFYRDDPSTTLMRYTWISLPALAVPALLVIMAWHSVPVLACAAHRLRRTHASGPPPPPSGRMRTLAVGLLGGAMALAALTFPRQRTSVGPGDSEGPRDPAIKYPAETGLDVDGMLRLAESPGGDAQLAAALLGCITAPDDSWLVAVEIRPDTRPLSETTSVGWPLTFAKFERCERWTRVPEWCAVPPPNPEVSKLIPWAPAPARLRARDGLLLYFPALTAPRGQLPVFALDVPAVALNAAALWVLWLLIHGLCRVAWWARIGRRLRRGLCSSCGYDLSGIDGRQTRHPPNPHPG